MPGVTIGDGAVIGSRAVITKDVAPYSIMVANNHVVRKRFDDDAIATLLEIKWWNWPLENIKQAMRIMCSGDIEKLANYYADHIQTR
jgi:chloramphenicol O-acetyltransferase type B